MGAVNMAPVPAAETVEPTPTTKVLVETTDFSPGPDPEFCIVHVIPSGEVKMTPEPTATSWEPVHVTEYK